VILIAVILGAVEQARIFSRLDEPGF